VIETCPVCHTAIMSAVRCPKHQAAVHQKHCFECSYFNEITFRCSFLKNPAEQWEKDRREFFRARARQWLRQKETKK